MGDGRLIHLPLPYLVPRLDDAALLAHTDAAALLLATTTTDENVLATLASLSVVSGRIAVELSMRELGRAMES